jgi:hypothetical protein
MRKNQSFTLRSKRDALVMQVITLVLLVVFLKVVGF